MNCYGYFETIATKNGDMLTVWKKADEKKVEELRRLCRKYNCYNPKYIPTELLKRVLSGRCIASEFDNVKSFLKNFDIDVLDDIDVVGAKDVLCSFINAGEDILECGFEELPWHTIAQNISEIYYFTKCVFEDAFKKEFRKAVHETRTYLILRRCLYSRNKQVEIAYNFKISRTRVGVLRGRMLKRMRWHLDHQESSKIIRCLLTRIMKNTVCVNALISHAYSTSLVDHVMNKYTKYGLIEPATTRIRHSETGDKIYERKEGEIISSSYTPDYYDLYY